MEIRVTVDNEDKIVRGVTGATSVEDVIRALADSCSKTGRYSLVRKYGKVEQALTPTDKIAEFLKKKGKSKEVTFYLNETKTAESKHDDETVKPERTSKRKSLPPKLKRRPKPAQNETTSSSSLKPNNNGSSNERVRPASALGTTTTTNPSQQHSTASLDRATYNRTRRIPLNNNNQQQKSTTSLNSRSNVSSKIAALTGNQPDQPPPPVRRRSKTPTAEMTSLPRSAHRRPLSAMSQGSGGEKRQAIGDFNRLISAQNDHLKQQGQMTRKLDESLRQVEADLRGLKQSSTAPNFVSDKHAIQFEMKLLEETINNNEEILLQQGALLDRLHEDQHAAETMSMEVGKVRADIDLLESQIAKANRDIEVIEKDIIREERLQQGRKRKAVSDGLRLELRKHKVESNRLNEMSLTTQKGIDDIDLRIGEKNTHLESLSRELRQVSLQQFICKTGTKVTVLPSQQQQQLKERPMGILKMRSLPQTPQSPPPAKAVATANDDTNAGGYWV